LQCPDNFAAKRGLCPKSPVLEVISLLYSQHIPFLYKTSDMYNSVGIVFITHARNGAEFLWLFWGFFKTI